MSVSTRLLPTVIAILLLLAAPFANAFQGSGDKALASLEERKILKNEHGAPILDSDGQKINYPKEELQSQVAPMPPRSGSATPVVAFDDDPAWSYAAFGSGIGKSNIIVAQNGVQPEVYIGGSTTTFGSNDYWHALRYDEAAGGYVQTYVSRYYPAGISRIKVADIVGDSAKEILIALKDGLIHVYDQASKAWVRTVNTAATGLTGLDVADVDDDGENELVLCTASHLYVYSGNGMLEWDMADIGGVDVAVGQMDADSALEIAVTSGKVIDSATRSVQWNWTNVYSGKILKTADIDDDNIDELIVAESWYSVRAYDVEDQVNMWSIPVFVDIGAIHVLDIDDDLVKELLIGDGQWGSIHAYDTKTQAEEWSIKNPEHGVTDIAVGDVDGDGFAELLWGAGATSTGEDHLYVVDWRNQQIKWKNIHLDGPFIGPEKGDVDGDGRDEVVAVSYESDSGYGSGRILVFDGKDLRLRAISDEIVGGLAWTGTHDLKLRDVDQDGQLEILVAADRLYDGVIEIYDFDVSNAFSLNWTNSTRPYGASFHCVEAADIDNDGDIEIVGGVGREHTGAEGVFLYVYDYNTGDEEWHSQQLGEYWGKITGLGTGDVDMDGSKEIIGMVAGGEACIFDGQSRLLEAALPGENRALRMHDFGDGLSIVLGNNSGDLSIYNYIDGSYSEVYRRNFVSKAIDGFTIGSIKGKDTWWIGSGGALRAFTFSGALLWESALYGSTFGSRSTFLPTPRALLSAGKYSIVGFGDTYPVFFSTPDP